MIHTVVFWIFVVTGPNGVEQPWVEYDTRAECEARVDKHSLMGLSEYSAECRERHRTIILRPPQYPA